MPAYNVPSVVCMSCELLALRLCKSLRLRRAENTNLISVDAEHFVYGRDETVFTKTHGPQHRPVNCGRLLRLALHGQKTQNKEIKVKRCYKVLQRDKL